MKSLLVMAAMILTATAAAVCGEEPKPKPKPKPLTDQQRCEAEAAEMARRSYKGHVWGCIGRFEGCGWSSHSKTPPTCMPRYRMRLTGDAIVKGRDGWYRVRSWR